MARLFGTDGVRGVANQDLTAELALALGGALHSSGEVLVRGRRANLHSPGSARKAGISLVPDDRKRNSILPTRSTCGTSSAGRWST